TTALQSRPPMPRARSEDRAPALGSLVEQIPLPLTGERQQRVRMHHQHGRSLLAKLTQASFGKDLTTSAVITYLDGSQVPRLRYARSRYPQAHGSMIVTTSRKPPSAGGPCRGLRCGATAETWVPQM